MDTAAMTAPSSLVLQLPPGGRLAQDKSSGDVTLDRLEFLIDWYNRAATRARISYITLKVVQLLLAAAVPLTSSLDVNRTTVGVLGGAVVVMEGVQQLLRPHDNWLRYRTTTEALLREKYLWASHAVDYATAHDPSALLAQRTEDLVGREGAQWVRLQSDSGPEHADGRQPENPPAPTASDLRSDGADVPSGK